MVEPYDNSTEAYEDQEEIIQELLAALEATLQTYLDQCAMEPDPLICTQARAAIAKARASVPSTHEPQPGSTEAEFPAALDPAALKRLVAAPGWDRQLPEFVIRQLVEAASPTSPPLQPDELGD